MDRPYGGQKVNLGKRLEIGSMFVPVMCRLRATVNEVYSLASQRGLSKSPTGRLPLPFPVGSPGRVYFALFAQNIAGLVQTDQFKCLNDTRWVGFIKWDSEARTQTHKTIMRRAQLALPCFARAPSASRTSFG